MLVRPNVASVDHRDGPIDLDRLGRLPLQFPQRLLPDTRLLPPSESAVDRLEVPIVLR